MNTLKVTNDEEERQRVMDKREYVDTQNRFMEYRGRLRDIEKGEERKKHEDYARQCEENNRLLDAKDNMYRRYFQQFEENLNHKAKMYLD